MGSNDGQKKLDAITIPPEDEVHELVIFVCNFCIPGSIVLLLGLAIFWILFFQDEYSFSPELS